jgi:hypothetical protein
MPTAKGEKHTRLIGKMCIRVISIYGDSDVGKVPKILLAGRVNSNVAFRVPCWIAIALVLLNIFNARMFVAMFRRRKSSAFVDR